MKICIVPVCYNAHEDALRFLESVEKAFLACPDLELDVVLADNSTVGLPSAMAERQYAFTYRYLKNDNVGYFPAFSRALASLVAPTTYFDYVMVCNVDLVVASDFFTKLGGLVLAPRSGLIAPGIYSDKDGRDLNPKIMHRPSSKKFEFMRVVCSSPVLFKWYSGLSRMRERARSRSQKRQSTLAQTPQSSAPAPQKMYGAHGSFMIFTKNYFQQGASVDYPRFLFGEEVFVAEQLRMYQLEIEHAPCVRVFDKEHASTSQANFKFICGEHKKSYEYLISNFFAGKA
ncbi:glycosyltransferase [Pseudomonas putida]|uniref:glycosyltransferase family 2 protein n=1 Tax=Pseudomonas putida TaxID=303 RepID=UPI002ED0EA05|nr:glycosyltransferase [Pseudomonas putida]